MFAFENVTSFLLVQICICTRRICTGDSADSHAGTVSRVNSPCSPGGARSDFNPASPRARCERTPRTFTSAEPQKTAKVELRETVPSFRGSTVSSLSSMSCGQSPNPAGDEIQGLAVDLGGDQGRHLAGSSARYPLEKHGALG